MADRVCGVEDGSGTTQLGHAQEAAASTGLLDLSRGACHVPAAVGGRQPTSRQPGQVHGQGHGMHALFSAVPSNTDDCARPFSAPQLDSAAVARLSPTTRTSQASSPFAAVQQTPDSGDPWSSGEEELHKRVAAAAMLPAQPALPRNVTLSHPPHMKDETNEAATDPAVPMMAAPEPPVPLISTGAALRTQNAQLLAAKLATYVGSGTTREMQAALLRKSYGTGSAGAAASSAHTRAPLNATMLQSFIAAGASPPTSPKPTPAQPGKPLQKRMLGGLSPNGSSNSLASAADAAEGSWAGSTTGGAGSAPIAHVTFGPASSAQPAVAATITFHDPAHTQGSVSQVQGRPTSMGAVAARQLRLHLADGPAQHADIEGDAGEAETAAAEIMAQGHARVMDMLDGSTTYTLFERLGSWEVLTSVVDEMQRRLCTDPRTAGFFSGMDRVAMTQPLTGLLIACLSKHSVHSPLKLWEMHRHLMAHGPGREQLHDIVTPATSTAHDSQPAAQVEAPLGGQVTGAGGVRGTAGGGPLACPGVSVHGSGAHCKVANSETLTKLSPLGGLHACSVEEGGVAVSVRPLGVTSAPQVHHTGQAHGSGAAGLHQLCAAPSISKATGGQGSGPGDSLGPHMTAPLAIGNPPPAPAATGGVHAPRDPQPVVNSALLTTDDDLEAEDGGPHGPADGPAAGQRGAGMANVSDADDDDDDGQDGCCDSSGLQGRHSLDSVSGFSDEEVPLDPRTSSNAHTAPSFKEQRVGVLPPAMLAGGGAALRNMRPGPASAPSARAAGAAAADAASTDGAASTEGVAKSTSASGPPQPALGPEHVDILSNMLLATLRQIGAQPDVVEDARRTLSELRYIFTRGDIFYDPLQLQRRWQRQHARALTTSVHPLVGMPQHRLDEPLAGMFLISRAHAGGVRSEHGHATYSGPGSAMSAGATPRICRPGSILHGLGCCCELCSQGTSSASLAEPGVAGWSGSGYTLIGATGIGSAMPSGMAVGDGGVAAYSSLLNSMNGPGSGPVPNAAAYSSAMAAAMAASGEVRWSMESDGYAAGAQAQALNMHFGFLW